MDMIKYATFCAAAVASVTACGGGVSHDVAPTGQSVAALPPRVNPHPLARRRRRMS